MYSDAVELYSDYLRGMFESSGKTRYQFYGEILEETGLQASIDKADFGQAAEEFFRAVTCTLHEEHLLVAYCVRLVAKLYKARCSSGSATATEEALEIAYKYFEGVIPMGEDFLYYTKEEIFLSHCLEQGDLVEVRKR